jgi:hypothetical protein
MSGQSLVDKKDPSQSSGPVGMITMSRELDALLIEQRTN